MTQRSKIEWGTMTAATCQKHIIHYFLPEPHQHTGKEREEEREGEGKRKRRERQSNTLTQKHTYAQPSADSLVPVSSCIM